MTSDASTTTIGRYKPVVLTICGAAAAFSIYQIYKAAQQPSPGPGLRRRPAVHRPRRRRDSRSASPSPEVPDILIPAPEVTLEDATTVAETDITAQTNQAEGITGNDHLTELLYHIGENRARETGYIHRGVTCDHCGVNPIRGIRWHCMQCEDFDLCSECEAQGEHDRTHVFGKLKIPAPALVGSKRLSQPIIYTGHPGSLPQVLPAPLKRTLQSRTGFEIEQLDALYDQFSCLTTVHNWADDPAGLGSGIGRAGFDKGFFATYLNTPKHNLIYDRYFAFFDGDKNGVVDFGEYVMAISIHIGQQGSNAKLKAVFEGYDMDGDGFVSRQDFLHMLRSYFAVQSAIVNDTLEHEEGLGLRKMNRHLKSAQPLGAVFKTTFDHRGDRGRLPAAKVSGEDGARAELAAVVEENQRDDQQDRHQVVNGLKRYPSDDSEERTKRRRFYVDEEEGVSFPEDSSPSTPMLEDDSEISKQNDTLPNGHHSSISSSSSHEDNIDGRAEYHRGGYEMVPEEQDNFRDILYQVTQQSLNELLDPLFYDKETSAEQVIETKEERKKWERIIDRYQEVQNEINARNSDPLIAAAQDVQDRQASKVVPNTDGAHDSAVAEVTDSLRRLPTANLDEQVQAVERQVLDSSLDQLLSESGYSVSVSRVPTYIEEPSSSSGILPHERPSTPDLIRLQSRARNALERSSGRPPTPSSPLFVPDGRVITRPVLHTPKERRLAEEPDDERLQFYVYMNVCEEEIKVRGGEGRIGWEEFRAAVSEEDADGIGKFGFLSDWIRIGQL